MSNDKQILIAQLEKLRGKQDSELIDRAIHTVEDFGRSLWDEMTIDKTDPDIVLCFQNSRLLAEVIIAPEESGRSGQIWLDVSRIKSVDFS